MTLVGATYNVLDHGHVKFIESWGSDERIIEAARMSTGKGFLGWGSDMPEKCARCGKVEPDVDGPNFTGFPDCETVGSKDHDWRPQVGDEKLLRFLYENKHATPFEMGGLVLEVQAPIFVFREWHRHRTQSYNELSARYTPLPDVNYVPTVERLLIGSDGKNRQAGTVAGAACLTESAAGSFRLALLKSYARAESLYQEALAAGVPKELARVHLPVGRYSRMRASANLRNWLGFLSLRMAPNAQWEIRQFANAVGEIVADAFPRTWSLFAEKRS